MISEQFIIGIDDTDGPGCEGTGALVRALAAEVESAGWGRSLGVTRHALMQSDKVAATGENFAYALVIETTRSVLDLEDDVVDFVRAHASREADPGVALASRHSDVPHILAFGRRAQTEVMRLDWAQTFSTESNVSLRSLGQKRLGSIGALAAAGLRAGGGDGRFIDLAGIREVEGVITAGEVRERLGIETVLDEDGEPLDRDDPVETFGWLRPRLEGGKPVLHTRRTSEDRHRFQVVDRRPSREPAGD
ncbi:MAG: hypothetical protein M0R73_11710 [Dehalococcoidia bacterium]|nr:hypothetical protein [Dehalococcoidia bacterium]